MACEQELRTYVLEALDGCLRINRRESGSRSNPLNASESEDGSGTVVPSTTKRKETMDMLGHSTHSGGVRTPSQANMEGLPIIRSELTMADWPVAPNRPLPNIAAYEPAGRNTDIGIRTSCGPGGERKFADARTGMEAGSPAGNELGDASGTIRPLMSESPATALPMCPPID